MKHTPGPWTEDLPHEQILGPDGQIVVYELNTNEYDAHIISAAPELLEALKACQLQMLQSNNNSEYAEEANQLAITAIAKAEVRPPK